MSMKHHHRGLELSASKSFVSKKWTFFLCIGFFCAGTLFSDRMWPEPEANVVSREASDERLHLVSDDCDSSKLESKDSLGEAYKSPDAIQTLDKTISTLEMELAAARAAQESIMNGSPVSDDFKLPETATRRKYLMVVGVNTAFSSRKRRDSVRATWMPPGENRKKLEEEKGIVMRFVIGHSATPGGILDRAIQAEESKHGDFLRLDHVEGYLELSAKTKSYFTTAYALWDADFYVKVDDDVHVNIATLGAELARYRMKPRVYIGCMKSGPVLAQKGVRYHEPEYWKFGEEGNKYFRHATGQLYAISRELASYISINQNVLHKYVNEDVSLGSWFLGLDVEHVDDRRLCCGTTATNGIVLTQKKAEKIPEEEPLLPFGSSRCPNKYRGPKHNNECSYGCGACDGRRCLQVCVGPKRLLMSVKVKPRNHSNHRAQSTHKRKRASTKTYVIVHALRITVNATHASGHLMKHERHVPKKAQTQGHAPPIHHFFPRRLNGTASIHRRRHGQRPRIAGKHTRRLQAFNAKDDHQQRKYRRLSNHSSVNSRAKSEKLYSPPFSDETHL
ncbi:unnamed protein product [Brassica oleracea]